MILRIYCTASVICQALWVTTSVVGVNINMQAWTLLRAYHNVEFRVIKAFMEILHGSAIWSCSEFSMHFISYVRQEIYRLLRKQKFHYYAHYCLHDNPL